VGYRFDHGGGNLHPVLIEVGMWFYVYGLMENLPACTVPQNRAASPARWWHWIVAVFLPLFFIIPLALWLAGKGIGVFWRLMSRKSVIAPGEIIRDREEAKP
jgi:hypothetical protein